MNIRVYDTDEDGEQCVLLKVNTDVDINDHKRVEKAMALVDLCEQFYEAVKDLLPLAECEVEQRDSSAEDEEAHSEVRLLQMMLRRAQRLVRSVDGE